FLALSILTEALHLNFGQHALFNGLLIGVRKIDIFDLHRIDDNRTAYAVLYRLRNFLIETATLLNSLNSIELSENSFAFFKNAPLDETRQKSVFAAISRVDLFHTI